MKLTKHLLKLCSLALILIVFSSGKGKSSFRLVLLPDTQTYTSNYPEIFKSQTSWIAENAGNIAFVLHQGDITNNNNDLQWKVASESLSLMDGKVPYTFVPGNHDTGEGGNTLNRDMSMLNKYLPYEKYNKLPTFGGVFTSRDMSNSWHTFKAGGYNWLILSLEFGPRNKVLDWAAGIIEAHPKHKVIINTHVYLYSDDTRMSENGKYKWIPQNYTVGKDAGPDAVNNGEQMWEKLVKKYANIMFVFCGHVLNDGTGSLVSEGIHGNKVYQMLANYQGGVEGTENGGNGFLRIITIDPQNSRISVQTYSPYMNKYKTEHDQQFTFENVHF